MQRGRSTSRTCVVANCAKGRETRAGYCAEHARLAQSGGAGGASWVADEETDVCVTTLTMHTAAHNPTLIHPPHAFVRRCSDSSYGAGSQQHDRSLRLLHFLSFTPPTLPRAPLPKTTYDNRARRLMCCRNRCAICTTLIKPSMFKSGKHHCRRCGQLVCGKCSTKPTSLRHRCRHHSLSRPCRCPHRWLDLM